MRYFGLALSYIFCAVTAVLCWRIHVIHFGMVSVRHFTPEQVATIYSAAVVFATLFMVSLFVLYVPEKEKHKLDK